MFLNQSLFSEIYLQFLKIIYFITMIFDTLNVLKNTQTK